MAIRHYYRSNPGKGNPYYKNDRTKIVVMFECKTIARLRAKAIKTQTSVGYQIRRCVEESLANERV